MKYLFYILPIFFSNLCLSSETIKSNVAVLDNGFYIDHFQLQSSLQLDEGWNCRDKNKDLRASIIIEENGVEEYGKTAFHGTSVAGVLVKTLKGHDVGIIPYKLGCSTRPLTSWLEGLKRLKKYRNVQIINLSIVPPVSSEECRQALIDLAESDKLLIMAAGNFDGSFGATSYDSLIAEIATITNRLIIVGASEFIEGRGQVLLKNCQKAGLVKDHFIVAPGSQIMTTVPLDHNDGGFQYVTGTSVAAPYVAGCLGILISEFNCTIDQARNALFKSADKKTNGRLLRKDTYGHGIINLEAAQFYLKKKHNTTPNL